MDMTYGEEIPLDAVASLFAASSGANPTAASSSTSSSSATPSSSSHQALTSTHSTSKSTNTTLEDEMEEGEMLEDGEISESSSDEADLVAATLIAPSRIKKSHATAKLQSFPSKLPPTHDLSLRIASSPTSVFPIQHSSYPKQLRHTPPQAGPSPSSSSFIPPLPPSLPPPSPPPLQANDTRPEPNSLEEYEQLIDELNSYGVTCDYLIGRGVSKDLAINTYARKGYKLPQHHLNRYFERQQQWRDHQASLANQQQQHQQQRHASSSSGTAYSNQNHQYQNQLNFQDHAAQATHAGVGYALQQAGQTGSMSSRSKVHHRSVSSASSDGPIKRMGSTMPTPPTSAPSTSTNTQTKRRRDSQDISTSSPSSLPLPTHPSSVSFASPTMVTELPSSMQTAASELQALKEELARKEARAKEALQARKAALAKQNAERAESFIEGLLSASAASDLQAQGGQGSGSLDEVRHSASMSKSSSSGDNSPSGRDQAASGTSAAKSPSQPTSDLEDYETAIEASSTASAATLLSTSTSLLGPTSRPAPPRRISSSTASQSHRSSHPNRPVAIDFESDPASSLPNVPRWTKQLIESQRRRNDSLRNGGMVIDLSDSEEEGEDEAGEEDDDKGGGQSDEGTLYQPENLDEELRQAVKESRAQDAQNHAAFYQISNTPYPSYSLTHTFPLSRENSNTGKEKMSRASPAPPSSLTRSIRVSPMPSGGSTSNASSSFSHHITSPPSRSVTVTASVNASSSGTAASRSELEAKQAEIKKMLEMIKQLEGKKKQKQKQGVGTSSTSNASSRAGTPSKAFTEEQKAKNVTSQLAEADLQKATIQAAKDRVDRLIDEKQKLVESAPLSDAATANGDAPESDMEEGQVGEEASPKPSSGPAVESKRGSATPAVSPPSSSLPAPSRRDSSSSEAAMSISSGD